MNNINEIGNICDNFLKDYDISINEENENFCNNDIKYNVLSSKNFNNDVLIDNKDKL